MTMGFGFFLSSPSLSSSLSPSSSAPPALGILDDQRELLAVRRPGNVADIAFEPADDAAPRRRAVDQPDLILARPSLAVAAAGDECDAIAVRAEARRAFAFLRAVGELNRVRAVEARHPDMAVILVFLELSDADRVGDPVAIRRDLRIGDHPLREHVVEVRTRAPNRHDHRPQSSKARAQPVRTDNPPPQNPLGRV